MLDDFKAECSGVDSPYETELLKTVSDKKVHHFHSVEVSEAFKPLYTQQSNVCSTRAGFSTTV